MYGAIIQMAKYTYYINLDERGEFFADVRDQAEKTIFEIHSNDSGEIEPIVDGYMRHGSDLKGLADYLSTVGLINKNDSIIKGN